MSRIGIWFWDELLPNHTYSMLCGFGYRFCFGVSRKPRGSFAEAPRKKHMPKQRYSLRMPSKTNERPQSQKWKQMKAQKAKMKGNETNRVQPQPETLENVVALWSRKQKPRKQGRGSSRKGYMWNACRGSWRCGRGRIAEDVAEAMNNFLSTTKEKNKTHIVIIIIIIIIIIMKNIIIIMIIIIMIIMIIMIKI